MELSILIFTIISTIILFCLLFLVYRIRNEIINLNVNIIRILNILEDNKKEPPESRDDFKQVKLPPSQVFNLVIEDGNLVSCPKCKVKIRLEAESMNSKYFECPACGSDIHFSASYQSATPPQTDKA